MSTTLSFIHKNVYQEIVVQSHDILTHTLLDTKSDVRFQQLEISILIQDYRP